MNRYFGTILVGISLCLLSLSGLMALSAPLQADDLFLTSEAFTAKPTPANTKIYGRLYSRDILRGVTLKSVYKYNDIWTTTLGPAYANITEQASNF